MINTLSTTGYDHESDWKPMLIFAVVITMFLFYIDEGYYNFNWMLDLKNWVAFVIYMVPMLISQLAVSEFVLFKMNGLTRTIIAMITGVTIALYFVLSIL